jgi:aryl-phospho-beta-D-glucosidase BglC (GH1 family)
VGQRWFAAADRAGVGALDWATGEWWGTTYPLSPYVAPADGSPVSAARSGAAVLEAHLAVGGATGPGVWRGVTDAGGEFAGPGALDSPTAYSNANPGVYDTNYHYDQAATFTYLAGRGITLVRIPFRWESIQPTPFGPLDVNELDRLRATVARAHAAGVSVLLDIHNFGAYWLAEGSQGVREPLGSSRLPTTALADVWSRLATAFAGTPGVVGYGLMAEPIGLPGATERDRAIVWEQASQQAVDAIRRVDARTTILVPGSEWSAAAGWAARHPHAWINDPNGGTRYEAHEYFDEDNSGTYTQSYATEVQHAQNLWGTSPC